MKKGRASTSSARAVLGGGCEPPSPHQGPPHRRVRQGARSEPDRNQNPRRRDQLHRCPRQNRRSVPDRARRLRLSAIDGDRRGRLSRAARAVRGQLSLAVADRKPSHSVEGFDRRGDRGAERHVAVAGRGLARARGVRPLWRGVRGQSRFAPHSHRLWLRRPPAAQGFPADRLCRIALLRSREARGL